MDGFVSQRTAAADDADGALLVNAAGHDADFEFAWGDDAWAIGADQARFLEVDGGGYADHVDDWNAFGDADDQWHLRVGGFEDGIRGEGRRNKDYRGVGARGFYGFGYGVEYRTLEMLGAAFAGGDSADDVGAVFDHLLRVKRAFAAGEALDDEARFFVYENAHRAPPARATTLVAPSFMPSAMVKFRPESRRICWPISTLVPSMRTTTGTLIPRSLAAATTPVARTSQRKMPPKMLMKTARTLESLIRIRKAFFTCSADAPPP